MTNVLHVLASNKFSGAENVACTIIKNLDKEKYKASYCCPRGPIEKVLKENEINYIPLNKLSIRELQHLVEENNIDIIHAHDFKASFISAFIYSPKKISHLHFNPKLLKHGAIFSRIFGLVVGKLDKLIVVSNEIVMSFPFKKKIEGKTTVLPNVVDANEIRKKAQKKNTKKYDFVFLGRLIDTKQPLLFISIVESLSQADDSVSACMIGDGPLASECKKYIKNHGLEKTIDLIGFQKNPYPYLKNAKILIFPSKYEGLPMSVIEALILKTPVLSSGTGGLREVFKDHPEYICTSKKDYEEKTKKILEMDAPQIEKDCEEISRPYVNMENYMTEIMTIYNMQ